MCCRDKNALVLSRTFIDNNRRRWRYTLSSACIQAKENPVRWIIVARVPLPRLSCFHNTYTKHVQISLYVYSHMHTSRGELRSLSRWHWPFSIVSTTGRGSSLFDDPPRSVGKISTFCPACRPRVPVLRYVLYTIYTRRDGCEKWG